MEGFDGRVYFRLLAAVAAADGVIHEAERAAFGQLLEKAGADALWADRLCDEAVEHVANPLWFLSGSEPPPRDVACIYVRDALIVGMSDGTLARVECGLVQRATRLLGVGDLCETVPALRGAQPTPTPQRPSTVSKTRPDTPSLEGVLKVAGGAAILAGTAAAGVFVAPAVMGAVAAGLGVKSLTAASVTLVGAGIAKQQLLKD